MKLYGVVLRQIKVKKKKSDAIEMALYNAISNSYEVVRGL
jgi:hypothetical protein